MSAETRQPFSLAEQRAKDLLEATKTVVPVISIIREWGKAEKEYNEVEEKQNTLSKEIESIRYVLEISYTDSKLKDSLSTLLKKKEASYEEVSKRVKQLKDICDSYEEEVINYQEYVKSFTVDEDIVLDVLNMELLRTKDEGLAIIFFIINNHTVDVRRLKAGMPFFFKDFEGLMYRLLSTPNWNKMLRQLKAGEI